jgi:hypothetical protein
MLEGSLGARVLMSANGIAVLVFGIFPYPLLNLCLEAIKAL